jgi:hypothetical protein
VVEIWNCDAVGSYSGFEAASADAPGGGWGSGPTRPRRTFAAARRRPRYSRVTTDYDRFIVDVQRAAEVGREQAERPSAPSTRTGYLPR